MSKIYTGIYKITNPKGKIYIGQSINILQRFTSYKKTRSNSMGPKLLYSLKKYGYDNHQFEIIEECESLELNSREVYWKVYYNSVNSGLNCELYDNSTGPKNNATKAKISETLKKRNIGQRNVRARTIIQCDKLGNPIREWPSGLEIHKVLGYYASAISECYNKKRRIYKGFIWMFK